jgi:predicted metalloprotease with PDZ domain
MPSQNPARMALLARSDRPRHRGVFSALLFLFLAGAAAAQVEKVVYTVEYRREVLDRAFVTATVAGKANGPIDVQIPTWTPGAYEIKPFYKRILSVAARDAKGVALAVTHPDNLTWHVEASADWPIFVTYERLDQPQGLADSGRAGPRLPNYVGFLPTDTFMYVVGAKTVPHEVRFRVPEGWLVQMSLPRGTDPLHFIAPDYDTIVDAPVELGHLTVRRFQVGDAIYSIVLDFRDPSFALGSLEALLRRIIRYQVGMWGAKAPYAEYQFQFHDGPGFGLEHLTSTTLAVPTVFLRMQGPGVFDSLYAHEYFHVWNVKRLRPKQLGPFDYTQPVRTKALWLCEGITDYYADVTCWRTGIWSDGKFLATMQDEIQRLQTTPARLMETVEASSWAAFDRGYDGLGTQQYVDYYNKGKLIGLVFDLVIRDRTRGERSLDDVMRGLYAKYALPNPGYDDDALAKEFSDIAGFDFRPLFEKYVSGVEELPFAEALATIGVRYTPGESDTKGALAWWQRSRLAIDGGQLVVREPSETLAGFGFSAGDRVLAVNERPLPAAQKLQDVLGICLPRNAGAAVVRVRRGEETKDLLVPFPLAQRWDLELIREPTPEQRVRFEQFKADRYSALVPNGPTLETIGLPRRR